MSAEFLNQKVHTCIQLDLVKYLIPYPELILVQKFKIKALDCWLCPNYEILHLKEIYT